MDILDIILEAQAEVEKQVQAALMEIMEPKIKQAISLQWAMLPDEARELLKKTNRPLYDRVIGELK